MTQPKIILVGVIAGVAAIASVLVQRHAQAEFHQNEALLQQQENQIVQVTTDNQRISNLLAQAEVKSPTADDRQAELARLSAKAEALRQQINELAKQVAEHRRFAGPQFYSLGDFNLLGHNRETAITSGGGPTASGKLNDARAITAALRRYASEYQGEFPLKLDKVAPYLPKPLEPDAPPTANTPLTGTNDFEIVFQGSQNDLTNIPARRVALIRERHPWLTPDGKWARVYGYADGAADTVESDDNFQSWEAQHIIPSRVAGQ